MAISRSMPMFMVLSWIYSVSMIVKGIVYEKERRLKEVMKVMGLGNGVHWLAWFITAFIMMFISVIMLLFVLKVSTSGTQLVGTGSGRKTGSSGNTGSGSITGSSSNTGSNSDIGSSNRKLSHGRKLKQQNSRKILKIKTEETSDQL